MTTKSCYYDSSGIRIEKNEQKEGKGEYRKDDKLIGSNIFFVVSYFRFTRLERGRKEGERRRGRGKSRPRTDKRENRKMKDEEKTEKEE